MCMPAACYAGESTGTDCLVGGEPYCFPWREPEAHGGVPAPEGASGMQNLTAKANTTDIS